MNKIDNKCFSIILIFLTSQLLLSIGINHILTISYQNTIYIPVISIITSFIPFLLIIRYFNYLPSLNLFEKINYTYKTGKILSFIVFIILLLYFIYSLSTVNIYIQNKYLNETPTLIISLLFIVPVIYINRFDIRTIFKTFFLLLIIFLFFYLISILGLFKYFSIDNLKPFIDKDFTILLKSSTYYSLYSLFPTFLILLVPKDDIKNPKTINIYLIVSYIVSNIILLFIFIFLIGTLGIDLSILFDFPIFSLLKKINFFDFITHIENILSFMSIIVLFVNTSICFYGIKIYVKNNKILFILLIPLIIISLVFLNNNSLLFKLVKDYYIYSFIIILLILLKKRNIK